MEFILVLELFMVWLLGKLNAESSNEFVEVPIAAAHRAALFKSGLCK